MNQVVRLKDLDLGYKSPRCPSYSSNRLLKMMNKLDVKRPASLIKKLDMADFSFKQRVIERLIRNPCELVGPARLQNLSNNNN